MARVVSRVVGFILNGLEVTEWVAFDGGEWIGVGSLLLFYCFGEGWEGWLEFLRGR